jgi:DNA-binding MarR family transcriptional regulator
MEYGLTREISEQLSYLLVDVARHLRRHFDSSVRDLGLTQSQWRVIVHLKRSEGISQAALADRLEIKPITLTRILDRMASAGWIVRRPSPQDRRAVQLFLTPKVGPLLAILAERATETRRIAFAGVPDTTRRQLVASLETMKQNLQSADAAEPRPDTVGSVVKGEPERARRRA